MSVLEDPVSLFLMTQPVSKMIPVADIKPTAGMFRIVREASGNVEWLLRCLEISPHCEHGIMGNMIDLDQPRCTQIAELAAKIAKVDTILLRYHKFPTGSTQKQVTIMQLRIFQQLMIEALNKMTEIELDELTNTLRPVQLVALRWAPKS